MIGFRGAARYLSADFADCFAMECDALRYVCDTMGLTNVKIMIPPSAPSRRLTGWCGSWPSTDFVAVTTARK
jgi:hypothetical protein